MPPPLKVFFPRGGVSDRETPYIDQPGAFAPPPAMRNVRLFDVGKDRARGGQRPGTRKLFELQGCAGLPVQQAASIATAAVTTGYVIGVCAEVGGWEPRTSGLLEGQCWMLGRQPAMFRDFYDSRGGGIASAYACKWHPLLTNDIRRAVFATIFTDATKNGGIITSGISLVDELGATLWTATLEDKAPGGSLPGSPARLYVNHVNIAAPTLGSGLVLVSVLAESTTGGLFQGWLYVYKATDGTYLQRYSCYGWAGEVVQTAVRPDNKIGVLFLGSGAAGSTVGLGPIEVGTPAIHFRSGLMLFEQTGDLTANGNPIQQVSFSEQLDPLDPFFEDTSGAVPHGYFRFSEKLARAPRGCYPTSVAATSSGGFVLTFSNKGWGPGYSFTPNDEIGGYSTVALIDATGDLVWEVDTDSIKGRDYVFGSATFHNDIPTTGDPFASDPPSIFASAVGLDGEVFVGGARNSASTTATDGFSVFCLDGTTGTILWKQGVGNPGSSSYTGTVAQAGLAVDPTDGNLLVAGKMNDKWGRASQARKAHLWKLDRRAGGILWDWSIFNNGTDTDAEAATAYGVDVDDRGRIIYCTDRVAP